MMGWDVPEEGWRKGPWTPEEDRLLHEYVNLHGDVKWSSVSKSTGLRRSGKSCRLRWVNYLRPGLKRCQITPQEEAIIVDLHSLWGNKWSMIARYLPGRTDNEIKNYWRTHFKRKEKLDPSRRARRKEYQMMKQKQKQGQEQHDHQEDALVCNEKHVTMEVLGKEEMDNMVFMYSGNYSDHYNWDDQRWPGEDVGESFVGEEGMWSGLWNMDDSWPL